VPHYSEATLPFNTFGSGVPSSRAHAILNKRGFERGRGMAYVMAHIQSAMN
jgi:hypothetical protein